MLQTSISQSMSLVSPMLETSTAYSCLVTDFGSRLSIARSPRSHVQQVDYVYATLGGWLSLRCYSPQVCGNRARVSGIVPGETEIRFDLPAATSHQAIGAVSKKYSEKEALSMQRMMTIQGCLLTLRARRRTLAGKDDRRIARFSITRKRVKVRTATRSEPPMLGPSSDSQRDVCFTGSCARDVMRPPKRQRAQLLMEHVRRSIKTNLRTQQRGTWGVRDRTLWWALRRRLSGLRNRSPKVADSK
jgi:hypothetical protein